MWSGLHSAFTSLFSPDTAADSLPIVASDVEKQTTPAAAADARMIDMPPETVTPDEESADEIRLTVGKLLDQREEMQRATQEVVRLLGCSNFVPRDALSFYLLRGVHLYRSSKRTWFMVSPNNYVLRIMYTARAMRKVRCSPPLTRLILLRCRISTSRRRGTISIT